MISKGVHTCDVDFEVHLRVSFCMPGGRTLRPEIDFSPPPEIFDKKRVFNFLTRKMACFSSKILANSCFSHPGNFCFYPSPTGKPEKTLTTCMVNTVPVLPRKTYLACENQRQGWFSVVDTIDAQCALPIQTQVEGHVKRRL